MVEIPVMVTDDPPQRVGTKVVHETGQRGFVAGQVETLPYNIHIAEDRIDNHYFGVHIADPYCSVPFYAVPKLVLHVQVHRVCAGFPDAVEPVVITLECTFVFKVAIQQDGPSLLQFNAATFINNINTNKPKSGVPELKHTCTGGLNHRIMNSMVLIRAMHGLADGFTESDAQPDGTPVGLVCE